LQEAIDISQGRPRGSDESVNKGAGGPQRRSQYFGEEKNVFFVPGFEPRILQVVPSHHTNYAIPLRLLVVAKGKGAVRIIIPKTGKIPKLHGWR
jgi:hypothetical protein